jgi:hypothetical protein
MAVVISVVPAFAIAFCHPTWSYERRSQQGVGLDRLCRDFCLRARRAAVRAGRYRQAIVTATGSL